MPAPTSDDDAQIEIGEAEIDAHDLGIGLEIGESEIDHSLGELELDLSAEQQQRIEDVVARLHVVDFYALLAVPRTADTTAIKRAYNELVSELHPDRFFRKRLGPFRRKLDAVFMRLSEARDVLCSAEHRARYDELIRDERVGIVDDLVEKAVEEIAAAKQNAHREEAVVDRSVRVPSARPAPHGSGVQPAVRVTSVEEIARLRELHDRMKRAGRLEQGDRERYEALRRRFTSALRVPCAFRLTLSTAGRAHNTITLDLSEEGLSALVGTSLPVGATCELVLHVAPGPVCACARVVSSVRHGSGNTSFRVSVAFEPIGEPAAERLSVLVLDAALRRATKDTKG